MYKKKRRTGFVMADISKSVHYVDLYFTRVLFCQNQMYYMAKFPYDSRTNAINALQFFYRKKLYLPKTVSRPEFFICKGRHMSADKPLLKKASFLLNLYKQR